MRFAAVLVLQRTAKKYTMNYNARAQPLFCSLNLLFSGDAVAVAVVARVTGAQGIELWNRFSPDSSLCVYYTGYCRRCFLKLPLSGQTPLNLLGNMALEGAERKSKDRKIDCSFINWMQHGCDTDCLVLAVKPARHGSCS